MSDAAPDVLLVRGAPGVGKSSAVRELRRLLGCGATIEVDDLRRMIVAVRWVDREHHLVALDHARLLVRSFLDKGFVPVVVVDTFSRRQADPFARSLGRSYRIASLVAERPVLEQRIQSRPVDAFRDVAASMTLDAEARRDRFEADTLIDTTTLTPLAVAEQLAHLLRGTS